jgi:hypothetical protein
LLYKFLFLFFFFVSSFFFFFEIVFGVGLLLEVGDQLLEVDLGDPLLVLLLGVALDLGVGLLGQPPEVQLLLPVLLLHLVGLLLLLVVLLVQRGEVVLEVDLGDPLPAGVLRDLPRLLRLGDVRLLLRGLVDGLVLVLQDLLALAVHQVLVRVVVADGNVVVVGDIL